MLNRIEKVMATGIIHVAVSLLAFLIPYYAICVLKAWVNVYVLGHWDAKFGQEGSFNLSLEISNFLAVTASVAYLAGCGIVMVGGMKRSLLRMNIVAFSAGVISSGSMSGLGIIGDKDLRVGIFLIYLIGGPMLWTYVLSWLAAKVTKQPDGVTDAA
jgi:hypothetical protein